MKLNNRKTEIEKAELIRSYRDSGKTKKAWCKETGVGLIQGPGLEQKLRRTQVPSGQ